MGVKSLWTLLTPVGRPVMLETVEGKVMAIDSSIWIYQFQATMRDKEGRGLVNAHVLGFLRRIAKLLFYGIKPVFVFDGGAPVLKRSTLNERRKKKAGAAVSHAKLAERLLAAQLRREALNYTKGKEKAESNVALEDMVYAEDLEPGAPSTPPRPKPATPQSSGKKKGRFHDHDPYRLPEVDLDAEVSRRTQTVSTADPRLATEEELRSFIEDMRPEDFDVNSPAFRELPTEVQYEIIGDLRLKSRQTSFVRLQKMLSTSRTPLDFSKQQIENLRQRNALTQQLLVTTDSIGSAHISIPVRIASERNKEYVLIKNDDGSGGWILGVRDPTGSRDKPIEIDMENQKKQELEDDDSDDMEEIEVPSIPSIDPDLREWQRENALGAISQRNTDKGLAPLMTKTRPSINRKSKLKPTPLFDVNESDISDDDVFARVFEQDEVAFAIQESFDNAKSTRPAVAPSEPVASTSAITLESESSVFRTPSRPSSSRPIEPPSFDDGDDDIYGTPSGLQTALRFAHASHTSGGPPSMMFGRPNKLLSTRWSQTPLPRVEPGSDDDMEPVPITILEQGVEAGQGGQVKSGSERARATPDMQIVSDADEDMEEVAVPAVDEVQLVEPTNGGFSRRSPSPMAPAFEATDISLTSPFQPTGLFGTGSVKVMPLIFEPFLPASRPVPMKDSDEEMDKVLTPIPNFQPNNLLAAPKVLSPKRDKPSPRSATLMKGGIGADSEGPLVPSTRSPTPSRPGPPHGQPQETVHQEPDAEPDAHEEEDQEFDAADLQVEEGEFAKFVSQVKGRDLYQVRREIDEEIATLNQQRKNAMRDAEDVNQQMINQIMAMLRLFGIPYITAPMEAEAQCAELVSLGLVDGVITDDSDVFLFGAARVFKNMFNQSKTVECFLLSDLERELGLDRDTLIQLAYLLGSDYTEGLAGVGPVVAMELVREFPGKDGLWKFKDWWTKVQSGKDMEKESGTKFRRMFKRRFKDLYIAQDWPNTAVRDAYYHPTVDSSEEPFKWGLPDVDGLRGFFQDELGWSKTKVDELLLPIVQKMNKRTQANALNKQGKLNDFIGISGGSGTMAPRQRQAYASKRLQQVVSDFRKKRVREKSEGRQKSVVAGENGDGEREGSAAPNKRRRAGSATAGASKKRKQGTAPRKVTKRGKKDDESGEASESGGEGSDDAFLGGAVEAEVPLNVELRPRPKPRPVPHRHHEERDQSEESRVGLEYIS